MHPIDIAHKGRMDGIAEELLGAFGQLSGGFRRGFFINQILPFFGLSQAMDRTKITP